MKYQDIKNLWIDGTLSRSETVCLLAQCPALSFDALLKDFPPDLCQRYLEIRGVTSDDEVLSPDIRYQKPN